MNLAYDVLHFIQAALPTAIIVVVVVLGLVYMSQSEKGKLAISGVALRILDAISKGVEWQALDKADRVVDKIEQRLSPPEQFDRAITRATLRQEQIKTLSTDK